MLNKRNKWSLSIGCIGRDLCYTLVSLFLLTYIQYTGLVNTEQFIALTIIIVLCRVWDAINDPMMGTIITNTNTRFGKYRPWVLIGAVSNAVVLVLLFTVRFQNGWANVAFLGIMYLLWGMTFTMNDISYWDLLPALTSDKKERDNLTTLVAVFASVGAFASGGIVPLLTTGNMVNAYRWISIIFAAVFLLCQLLVFFFVHDNKDDSFIVARHPENEKKEKKEKINLKGMVKILIGNKQLLVMAGVIFLYSLGSAILNAFGQNFFYFKFGYLGKEGGMGGGTMMFIFTVVYAVGTLLSQAVYPFLANRFKRKRLMDFSIISLVAGYVAFFIFANVLKETIGFIVLCILGVLIFIGQGVFYLTMLVMLTNTIEYGEWKTGRNDAAIAFTVRPFMVKLASALQYGIVAITLVICQLTKITDAAGQIEVVIGIVKEGGIAPNAIAVTEYLSTNYGLSTDTILRIGTSIGAATDIDGVVAGLQQYENGLFNASAGSMWGLTAVMCVLPIVLFVVAWIFQKEKYIIDEELYDDICKDLKKKKEVKENA